MFKFLSISPRYKKQFSLSNITQKWSKILIFSSFFTLTINQNTLAQNQSQSLVDLLSGCSRSGYTYQCYNDDRVPLSEKIGLKPRPSRTALC